jgi:hypothetical protein
MLTDNKNIEYGIKNNNKESSQNERLFLDDSISQTKEYIGGTPHRMPEEVRRIHL